MLGTWYEDCGHVEELVPGEVQLHLQAAEVPPPLVLLGVVYCTDQCTTVQCSVSQFSEVHCSAGLSAV